MLGVWFDSHVKQTLLTLQL